MKNLRDPKSYDGEVFTEPSCTQPNMSMTIPEILARFASGIPANMVSQASYDEEITTDADNLSNFDFEDDVTREPGFGFEEAEAQANWLQSRNSKETNEKLRMLYPKQTCRKPPREARPPERSEGICRILGTARGRFPGL